MKHTHKYYLVKLGKKKDYIVYCCALPDCNTRLERSLAMNRKSLCWNCNKEFILYREKFLRVKPICRECANPALKSEHLDDLMKELGIE